MPIADAIRADGGSNDAGTHLVSVIIPCFNQGRFLADAVGSVLRQTYQRREVIIIDDGSSDHTAHVAKSFGDAIRYIYQGNRGLARARNRGIQASSGELLLFLDADDWVSPDHLDWQVNAAARFPEASVCLSDVAAIEHAPGVNLDSPVRTLPIDYPAEPVVPLEKLILGSCPYVHSAVVRRLLIDRIGGFDRDVAGIRGFRLLDSGFTGGSPVRAVRRRRGRLPAESR